jgi:hypothetical protein
LEADSTDFSAEAELKMWSLHHRDKWKDLDALEIVNSRNPGLGWVGGFVFVDRYDTFLRQLSQDYLRSAWQKLEAILIQYYLTPADLSWGTLHPGRSWVSGVEVAPPGYYFGWISEELYHFNQDARCPAVVEALQQQEPLLSFGSTYRSFKWRIEPDNFSQAMRLIEALSTDEITEWSPEFILKEVNEPGSAWVAVAEAIQNENQAQVEEALHIAKEVYSPIGYRILLKGFSIYVTRWQEAGRYLTLKLVEGDQGVG